MAKSVVCLTHVLTIVLHLARVIVAAHDLCFLSYGVSQLRINHLTYLLVVYKCFDAAKVLPQLLFQSVADKLTSIELV